MDFLGMCSFSTPDSLGQCSPCCARASLSPALKAMSLALSSARTSAVIQGFWFERMVIDLTVTSSMHTLTLDETSN